MSKNNKSNNQEHIVDSSLVPNEFLANQRKQKGIDERDAADALKISVTRLRSIEAGDYKEFPSETYIRGHLRNYSRFLKLDEEAVISAYDASNPPSFDYINPEKNIKGRQKPKRSWLFLLVLAILITIWVVAYNFLGEVTSNTVTPDGQSLSLGSSNSVSQSTEDGETNESLDIASDNTASNTSEDEIVNGQSVQEGEVSSQSIETLTEQVQESEASLNTGGVAEQLIDGSDAILENKLDGALSDEIAESDTAVLPLNDISSEPDIVVSRVTAAELVKSVRDAEESKTAEIAEARSSSENNGLSFSFENPCWVEVADASGEVLFAGLKPAGSNLRITGNAPFKIVLGNVDGASLTYNGEAVTLAPQRNGRPLRFVVGG